MFHHYTCIIKDIYNFYLLWNSYFGRYCKSMRIGVLDIITCVEPPPPHPPSLPTIKITTFTDGSFLPSLKY